ncbi:LacI family DNA-binding transcriptional regulator [Treponema sp.]
MAIKLKDIAKETGVSISTVSRILSKDTSRKSNSKTVLRVMEAARKMGYPPRSNLDSLNLQVKDKAVYSIGCILTSDHETYVSPFFSSLLAGIQNELSKAGSSINYHFFVVNIKDPGFSTFLESRKLDCAIMLGRTSLENIALLREKIPNLVYAGVNRIGEDIDEVICDAFLGASSAVRHLISLGHRKIGFIGPTQQKHQVFNEHRYRGYLDVLRSEGIEIDPNFVVDTILTAADGYESMLSLINTGKLPTALFCGNDTVALGVMRALRENDISIPQDISIVGFDNIDTIAYVKPGLTTIAIPTKELGRLAVKVLLDKLETKRDYTVHVNIPFKLLERESCRMLEA